MLRKYKSLISFEKKKKIKYCYNNRQFFYFNAVENTNFVLSLLTIAILLTLDESKKKM